MKLKGFLIYHKLTLSIALFFIIFYVIHNIKPGLVYNEDGSFREFGVGYKHKTVIPIWLVSIIAAILSYTFILYLTYFIV